MSQRTSTLQVNNNDLENKSGIERGRAERGARIKAVRVETGFNQAEFAQQIGITKQTQIAYESGARVPDADYLSELYYLFAIDLMPLITGAPRAKSVRVNSATEAMLFRYEAIPTDSRKIVDDVLRLAFSEHQNGKSDSIETGKNASDVLAKPAAKKVAKPKKKEPLL